MKRDKFIQMFCALINKDGGSISILSINIKFMNVALFIVMNSTTHFPTYDVAT